MNTAPIVSKVWSFCTTLRDDGVSYGDYLEQLTYLIFLKIFKIINPKYLEAYLISQDAKYYIDRMKTGINDSGLNLTHSRFKKLLIPLLPLHEQQRITDKIDELLSELDNSIRSLSKALRQMSLLYKTVLNDAFKKVEEIRLLKDLLSVKLSNGYSGNPVKHKAEYKVLSLSSTTSGVFKDEYFKFLDEKGLRCRDIWCEPNDILIQHGNTIEYVGVPAIFTGAPETFIFPDLMIRVHLSCLEKCIVLGRILK